MKLEISNMSKKDNVTERRSDRLGKQDDYFLHDKYELENKVLIKRKRKERHVMQQNDKKFNIYKNDVNLKLQEVKRH